MKESTKYKWAARISAGVMLAILFPSLDAIYDWKLWVTIILSSLTMSFIENYKEKQIEESELKSQIDFYNEQQSTKNAKI